MCIYHKTIYNALYFQNKIVKSHILIEVNWMLYTMWCSCTSHSQMDALQLV